MIGKASQRAGQSGSSHFAKLRAHGNLLALLLALALGQGVTVAVFLGLAWAGRADLVGGFSLGVQIASLALFVADFGGAVYLSRLSASRVRNGRAHLPRTALGALLLCRLLIAAPAAALMLTVATVPVFNEFTRSFILAATPAILIQTLNLAGALDGAGRAGAAGLSNALYFVLPTVGLALQAWVGVPNGFVLGALFTVGVAGAVMVQHAYARLSGRIRYDVRGSLSGARRALTRSRLRSVSGLFIYTVSGQLLARAQIIIAGFYFPVDTLGAIALAKQIANGASQVVGLFRRIELPKLVQRARAGAGLTVIQGVWIQRWGTIAAAVFAAVFALSSLLPAAIAADAQLALLLLATHAPAIVTTALLASAMQTCVARGEAWLATLSVWAVTAPSLAGIWFVSYAGFASALFFVEAVVSAVVFAALFVYVWRR